MQWSIVALVGNSLCYVPGKALYSQSASRGVKMGTGNLKYSQSLHAKELNEDNTDLMGHQVQTQTVPINYIYFYEGYCF